MPTFRVPTMALAILCLSACAGDDAGTALRAPDFVEGSRKENLDFLPIGVAAPPRPTRARSAESLRSLEADLEGARSANQARGRAATGAAKGVGTGGAAVPAATSVPD
jgi:hypothetical protein